MSEREDGSGSMNAKRVQPGRVLGAPPGLAVVLVLDANGPIGPGPAAVVGIVLAEAIALYVGYGALTRAVDPAFRRLFASD